jgi:hypothetical protein
VSFPARHPSTNWSVYGLVDYAVTRDQTLRVSYDQGSNTQKNLGVGGSDLIERAYSTQSQDHEFRAQVVGPFGRCPTRRSPTSSRPSPTLRRTPTSCRRR